MAVLEYRLPSPALRPYVRLIQLVEFSFDSSIKQLPSKPYWPRAENYLSFYPKDLECVQWVDNQAIQKKPRSVLIGQPYVTTNRMVGRECVIVQVVFQPGVLYRLTGIPLYELTNKNIDAEAIFSKEIRLVNERLSYTNSISEMIPIIEDFIKGLILKSNRAERPVDRIAQLMFDQTNLLSMDALARKAYLSPRQFYRQFTERMGISPKLYSRIIRFDKAVRYKNTNPKADWLSIAYDLEYYDYQHLVRDFKEFTNVLPNEFIEIEASAPERNFGFVEDNSYTR